MGLQDQWIKQIITQAKMNNMTIIGGTGAYLAALTGKQKGEIVIAYDTASGFIQWHIFTWDGVSSWIDITLPIHQHSSGSDGGTYQKIRQANNLLFDYIHQLPHIANWQQVISGTGAAINMNDNGTDVAMRMQTGTTSTGYATLYNGGVQLDFSQEAVWNIFWQLSAVNNLYFNLGLNMEDINAAQNNNAKIGLEWCDGQATANYYVTTASGSARSSSDSTVAITSTLDGVKMFFTPAAQASFTFDAGPTTINKTTNLPSTSTNANNVLRMGIKNNNGGVANRDLRIPGLQLIGDEATTQWI